MKKIVWIADFSIDEVAGGGELVDHHLVSLLKERLSDDHEVEFKKSREVTVDFVKQNIDSVFVVSNFVSLDPVVRNFIKTTSYFIMEHDHKYLKTRDPSRFGNLIAPKNIIINRDFYKKAIKVFCQSTKHGEVVEKNLKIGNIVSFGSTFWSEEHIKILESCVEPASLGKEKGTAVIKSGNRIKGQIEAENYCRSMNESYDLISDPDYKSFIEKLSKYSKLIFFPQVFETFSRLAVEARIVGCKMVGNQNISVQFEPWFKLKGKKLLEEVKTRQSAAEDLFIEEIKNAKNNAKTYGDMTVILNMYRRPENMLMQIEAIKKQTIQPKEIWVWINSHEDNEGFDKSKLDVDRIFDNNHNWKFYGRFAAALLADTEYVVVFDDDTIPGERWFENCLDTMKTHEGMLGTHGLTQVDEHSWSVKRSGWPSKNEEVERVDYVGHCWFFKRDWLQYLWKEKPPTWDNGEDMHFSYAIQKYAGLQTYVPPHPEEDPSLHGSLLGYELGVDSKATSNNNAHKTHQVFFTERDMCVNYALKNGWETVYNVKIKGEKNDLE
tara:strand:- start:549 stop:2198 length:1650 start_codon:yes stop_codon:yes gene_type:complete